ADQLVPVQVMNGTAVAVGRRHVCAIAIDGTVNCWGDAAKGRLGPGSGDEPIPTPVHVSDGGADLKNGTDVAAAGLSCAVLADKTAVCWGTNPHGQLGTGVGVYNPTPITRANGTPLAGIT